MEKDERRLNARALVGNLLAGFFAPDPGLLRLEQAVKAGLAIVTAGLVANGVISALSDSQVPGSAFFGAVSAFISFLMLVQGPRDARRRVALIAILPYAAGVALSALLNDLTLPHYLVLLSLMFLSFYTRRFGPGIAGLIMIGTFGCYLALTMGVEPDVLGWFELAAVIGFLSTFVWQFLLWPYRPERYLRQTVAAFERQAGATVDALVGDLKAGAAGGAETEASIQRRLRGVGATRRVIEVQFAAVVSVTRWTQRRLNQLRLHLYDIEQGLERMSLGTAELSRLTPRAPESVREALLSALAVLQRMLAPDTDGAAPPSIEELAEKRDDLRRAVEPAAGDGAAAWRLPMLQVVAGGFEVGQGVRAVRAIDATNDSSEAQAGKQQEKTAVPAKPAVLVPVLGRYRLPPTTVLALQAVLSAGTTMLVSAVLNLDHPWWAFWSAFVVIAGASGESRRKLGMRVVGTIAGAFAGTLISVIVPDTVGVVLGVVSIAMAMAVYVRPVSYTWMVFWIMVFVAALLEAGGEYGRVLIVRPINVGIGAAIAFVVVTYILPIPLAGRFRTALVGFLSATDRYIGALIAAAISRTESPLVDEAEAGATQSFETLAQTFPSADFDFNPFAEAQSPLTAMATAAGALHTDTDRLAALINTDAPPLSAEASRVVTAIQTRIHDNFVIIQRRVSGNPGGQVRSLADLAGASTPAMLPVEPDEAGDAAAYVRRLVVVLGRIQQTLSRLSDELRAETPMTPTSVPMTPSKRLA